MMAYAYKEKAIKLYGKAKERFIVEKIADCLREIEKAELIIKRLEKGEIKVDEFDNIDLSFPYYRDPDKS